MAVKLFLLGLPGSGKSTCARYIQQQVQDKVKGCRIFRMCDYDILYEMFVDDVQQKMFYPIEYGGFDVHDLLAFDLALNTLEIRVEEWLKELSSQSPREDLMIIEFARNDYAEALNLFKNEFYRDAYFLCLNVDVDICLQRIRERVAHPTTPDDHYVSEHIIDVYYHKEGKHILTTDLLQSYGINGEKVTIAANNGAWDDLTGTLDLLIDTLCSEIATKLGNLSN